MSTPDTLAPYAEDMLRCAWLRVHAELLREVDDSGQLSAHLLDHAHLLEARWSA